jgi:hypothetical protein
MQKVDHPFPALRTVENQKGLLPKPEKKGREKWQKNPLSSY